MQKHWALHRKRKTGVTQRKTKSAALQKQKALRRKTKSAALPKKTLHFKRKRPWRNAKPASTMQRIKRVRRHDAKTNFCVATLSLSLHRRRSGFMLRHSLFSLMALFLQQQEAKSLLQHEGKIAATWESSTQQNEKESVTWSPRRSVALLQSKVRALQCNAKTKRTAMQMKDFALRRSLFLQCIATLSLSLRGAVRCGSFASRCSLKLPTKIAALQSERDSVTMQSSCTA